MSAPATIPRISPVPPPYEPGDAEMLALWMPPGAEAEPLSLFRTLLRHPQLMARMRPLATVRTQWSDDLAWRSLRLHPGGSSSTS